MTENKDQAFEKRKDELLVVRCQLGERPAFDELIQRWNEPLRTYVRRMTGQDELAQDILQEAWLRVLRGIHRLRDGSKLRAWIFGIARRVLMDHWRQKYVAPASSDIDMTNVVAEEAPEIEEDISRLEEELARLPVIERDVLSLFYLRELSLADVAEVFDVPVGTVKSRLFRARQLLRHELETKGKRT